MLHVGLQVGQLEAAYQVPSAIGLTNHPALADHVLTYSASWPD